MKNPEFKNVKSEEKHLRKEVFRNWYFWFLSARRALLCFLFSCSSSSSNVCEILPLCPFSWVFFLPLLLRALPLSSLEFPRVPSGSLEFPQVPTSSIEFPWVVKNKCEIRKCWDLFLSFSCSSLTYLFLRALSYSTCLSIFDWLDLRTKIFKYFILAQTT